MNNSASRVVSWPQSIIKAGNFFFRFRNAIFPIIFAVVFIGLRPGILINPSVDSLLTYVGIAIALLGCAIRLFVIGFAYIVRGGRQKKVYADDLVRAGIYAHSRNPMYVGNFLIALGICMIYDSVWAYVIILPFFLFVYISIVAAEESFLVKKFGDQYASYCNEVPRFLPNLSGIGESLKGYHYDWKKVLRKEYGTLCGTLSGILVLLFWKSYYLNSYRTTNARIVWSAAFLLAVAAMYLTIRHLKHSGKLESSADNLNVV